MGNNCFKSHKYRYTYIVMNRKWYTTSIDSMLESYCLVCNQQITSYSIAVKCNECKSIIGHSDCINHDKTCMLCHN